MSQHSKYFQFQVSLLRVGVHPDDVSAEQAAARILLIRGAALVNMAAWIDEHSQEPLTEAKGHLMRVCEDAGLCPVDNRAEALRVAAADMLGMSAEQAAASRAAWTQQAEQPSGKFAKVRADILDDTAAGKIAWRDFSLLVSVMATCGQRRGRQPASKIANTQLAAMAAGYGSQAQAVAAGCPVLLPHQIRYSLDKLERRKWFVRVPDPSGRGQWFSNAWTKPTLQIFAQNMHAKKALRRKPAAEKQDGEIPASSTAQAAAAAQQARKSEQATKNQQLQELARWSKGQGK